MGKLKYGGQVLTIMSLRCIKPLPENGVMNELVWLRRIAATCVRVVYFGSFIDRVDYEPLSRNPHMRGYGSVSVRTCTFLHQFEHD